MMRWLPYGVVVIGVVVRHAAHAWFLRGVPQAVPAWFGAAWVALGLGAHVDRLGVSPWVSAGCALLGAAIALVGLPRIVRRAQLAEVGAAVIRGSHADLQRAAERAAEGERAARQLRRWVSATTSPPPADAREA